MQGSLCHPAQRYVGLGLVSVQHIFELSSCFFSLEDLTLHVTLIVGRCNAQVADFVDRYMPAYKAYLPRMYSEGPATAKAGHLLMLEIDQNRGLTSQQPGCPL